MTASGRIHLLIALIAFLAVAAGTLLAGYPLRSGLLWRGWSSPLMPIAALAILDLVLPGRHGFGVETDVVIGAGHREQTGRQVPECGMPPRRAARHTGLVRIILWVRPALRTPRSAATTMVRWSSGSACAPWAGRRPRRPRPPRSVSAATR